MGGKCRTGPHSDGTCSNTAPECRPVRPLRARRAAASKWAALFVFGIVIIAAIYASPTQFLMPGPLTTAHSLQTNCRSCHANVADGQIGWLHTILASAEPKKETAACLTCHKIDGREQAPHDLALQELKKRTKRVQSKAALSSPSITARFGNALLPVRNHVDKGIFCATCHKEHQGKDFDLNRVSNDRCHSCHALQFASFANGHPEFDSYPYKRRTYIIYDHASHFGKHFPEALKEKAASQSVPKVCTDCHSTEGDKRLMSVKPFKAVCSSCHLNQIIGTERASGPKGIAFITLPGLDLETLREKGASIGEWPQDSEAEVTPFMELLIGLDDHRRQILHSVSKLDLLDLSSASATEISAVEAFVWELKFLLHELSTSKASEIATRLSQATGARVDPDLTAKLVATIPRDVVLSAQREWLPNLHKEISTRSSTAEAVWKASVNPVEDTNGAQPEDASDEKEQPPESRNARQRPSSRPVVGTEKRSNLLPAQQAQILNSLQSANNSQQQTQVAQAGNTESSERWRVDPFGRLIKGDQKNQASDDAADDDPDTGKDSDSEDTTDASQSDDADGADESDSSAAEVDDAETENSSSDEQRTDLAVDAESWAELGGWYRRDFAILYKPAGHADAFLQAWLDFSGKLHGGGEESAATSVLERLSHKDAQGQCTKCHSVDQGTRQSRVIGWGTSTLANKSGRLTSFVHEPHFGLLDKRGCLTCHEIDATAKYQSGYEQRNPKTFVSNFKPMRIQQCTTCHKKNAARQDCSLCHTYHVNDVTSPIAETTIPEK
jgi:hypothetical protein